MIRKVQNTIRDHALIARGSTIVVGVSGGADSVALALVLCGLRWSLGFRLVVAHLDHRLRGRASTEDARFVARLARAWGCPFHGGRRDVSRLARARGISLEMAAREARHTFFRKVITKERADAVALAHTVDDQAETLLLRLCRGAGAEGLAGMSSRTTIRSMTIIRPLIDITREEAIRFLKRKKQTWREDESNTSPLFLRNRVRHELLPLLEREYNPGIRDALVRSANILRDEDQLVDRVARVLLEDCRDTQRGSALHAGRLSRQPVALQRRVVRLWLFERGCGAETAAFDPVSAVCDLAAGSRGTRRVSLPGNVTVVREYTRMKVLKSRQAAVSFDRVRLAVPGRTAVPDTDWVVHVERARGVLRDRRRGVGRVPAMASLDAKAVGRAAVYLRPRKPGDLIQPLGMRGTRKIQDVLVDAKIPVARREQVPLLECRKQVVWVPRYQVARGFGVEDSGAAALHIRIERTRR